MVKKKPYRHTKLKQDCVLFLQCHKVDECRRVNTQAVAGSLKRTYSWYECYGHCGRLEGWGMPAVVSWCDL